MATKKESQLNKLKDSMNKGIKLIEKVSKLNFDNPKIISDFKDYLLEIQNICSSAMDNRKLTIKYLKNKDIELNEKILKLNGILQLSILALNILNY